MEHQISKDDFEEWLTYPVTKFFMDAVKSEQDTALQILIKSGDMDSLTQAKFVGILSGLQKVLEIEYDDGTNN